MFILSQAILLIQAGLSAAKSLESRKFTGKKQYLQYWALTTFLHILQPIARLYGRIAHGLAPWRVRGSKLFEIKLLFKPRLTLTYWSETWKASEDWLQVIESNLIRSWTRVRRGGQFDQWDLQVSCGFLSSARGLLTIEEHGAGKQLLRFKCKPTYSSSGIAWVCMSGLLSWMAVSDKSYAAGATLGIVAIVLAIACFTDKARAMYDLAKAFRLLSTPVTADAEPSLVTAQVPDEQAKAGEESYLPDWLKETRIVVRNKSVDARQKRVLEVAVEDRDEMK